MKNQVKYKEAQVAIAASGDPYGQVKLKSVSKRSKSLSASKLNVIG
jgi:hypothetical protein